MLKVLTAAGHQTAAEKAWSSDLPLSNPAERVWRWWMGLDEFCMTVTHMHQLVVRKLIFEAKCDINELSVSKILMIAAMYGSPL